MKHHTTFKRNIANSHRLRLTPPATCAPIHHNTHVCPLPIHFSHHSLTQLYQSTELECCVMKKKYDGASNNRHQPPPLRQPIETPTDRLSANERLNKHSNNPYEDKKKRIRIKNYIASAKVTQRLSCMALTVTPQPPNMIAIAHGATRRGFNFPQHAQKCRQTL